MSHAQLAVHRVTGPKARHGYSYAAEYRAWQTMRLRCTEPSNPAYPAYGGRGIKVCERWLNSVEAFIVDMGPKPSPKHELDRFPDNNGNYEPGNCRWATRSENDRNRRNNRLIEFNGETLPLVAWAERTGIREDAIAKRLEAGWPVAEALSTPVRPKAPNGRPVWCTKHPCADCGAPTGGTWCKPCANRRNGARNAIREAA